MYVFEDTHYVCLCCPFHSVMLSWPERKWLPSYPRQQALGFPSMLMLNVRMLVAVCTSPWSCHGVLTRLSSSWGGHTGPTSLGEESGRVKGRVREKVMVGVRQEGLRVGK